MGELLDWHSRVCPSSAAALEGIGAHNGRGWEISNTEMSDLGHNAKIHGQYMRVVGTPVVGTPRSHSPAITPRPVSDSTPRSRLTTPRDYSPRNASTLLPGHGTRFSASFIPEHQQSLYCTSIPQHQQPLSASSKGSGTEHQQPLFSTSPKRPARKGSGTIKENR